ncbi:hypothetical protein LAZ67_5002303 [Cordylochernes scorpioides]|uniref:Uncharacterized protein n=1 Tax=Cordylochernes scorpioides TaxID=51811 RepID=A0ABY6KHE1_9ARAC|nr:hypothetical protein LAZ67_5002303 [Cordylochernes scorpioides]
MDPLLIPRYNPLPKRNILRIFQQSFSDNRLTSGIELSSGRGDLVFERLSTKFSLCGIRLVVSLDGLRLADISRVDFCGLSITRNRRGLNIRVIRVFLHRIVTSDEKWVHFDYPKRRATCGYPGRASSSSMAKPNIHGGKIMPCIWWDQLEVVYYELLQPKKSITGEVY